MKQIGRKIYFDLATGNVIQDTGEMCGCVEETTIDQDFERYNTLSVLNRETVGVKQLAYGEMIDSFMTCTGYKINPETNELVFDFTPQVIEEQAKQVTLEERIATLEQTIIELKAQINV